MVHLHLACNDRNVFFTSEQPKKYNAWSCQNVCDALSFLSDKIFIQFGTKLYKQVVGIPVDTNCALPGAQWLSGSVLDSRQRGRGFEPHRRHCVVVLKQDTFILAKYWFNPDRHVPVKLKDC